MRHLQALICRFLGHTPQRRTYEPSPRQDYAWSESCSRCGRFLGAELAPWRKALTAQRMAAWNRSAETFAAGFAKGVRGALERDRAERAQAFSEWQDES